MKITKIHLKDFHQFRDLTIDLTYPKGHEKEGQPLDKVCFIGQSGTGKTSLLEIIPKFVHNYNTKLMLKSGKDSLLNAGEININFGLQNEYSVNLYFKDGKAKVEIAVARGKKAHDKREAIKAREADREVARVVSRGSSGKSGKASKRYED